MLKLPFDNEDFIALKNGGYTFRKVITQAALSDIIARQEVSSAAWKYFWCIPITTLQRNMMYRFLTQKISIRMLLSKTSPDRFPTTVCILCGDQETVYHFFFRCPQKFPFWDALIREFLWPGTSLDLVSDALASFNFSRIRSQTNCPLSVAM
ncbi:hypothetical protein CU098_010880, partial [Rhizopus stolonifer]